LAYLIGNNDEYEVKSIHQLHYMFAAGLSHDKLHNLNVEHDAAKGVKSFVSCEFLVHPEPEATFAFRIQKNEKP